MAIKGDGAAALHELVAVGTGLPANTNSMCIAVHGRIDSDVNRRAGIACVVRYSGSATAHEMVVGPDGTSLRLDANYEATATAAVASLAVGTGYTMFMEGSGTDLILSLLVEGSATILTQSTTQVAFVPELLFLLGTNSGGSNGSADATAKWVGVWNAPLTDVEKRAVHAGGPAAKAGAITDRPFTGGNLGTALSAGSGAAFSAGEGISYVEWEGADPPKTVTITISADVDMQGMVVDPGTAPDITTTSLPAGQVGVPYAAQIVVTGTQPISIGASGLPAGVVLNPDGSLSGAPIGTGGIGGTYTVSVTANNEHGTDTASLTLVIADAGVEAPVITTAAMPDGRMGQSYSFTFTGSGAGPLTWEFSVPAPGLTTSGATVSGVPGAIGAFTVGARLTGAGASSSWRYYTLRIQPPLAKRRTESPWASTIRGGR